jgi:hypothetical protein
MKKKEIKKIAKQIFKQFKLENEANTPVKSSYREEFDWSEYDEDTSSKFKKMILQIIEYNSNLRINLNESNISISINDIKLLKSNNLGKNSSDDNYLEINIVKDVGFLMVKGYNKRSQYKDTKMFNELDNIIKDRLKIINRENFNEIWDNIMVESGLIRDNNLLDILKDN